MYIYQNAPDNSGIRNSPSTIHYETQTAYRIILYTYVPNCFMFGLNATLVTVSL